MVQDRSGRWLEAPVVPDTFICNIGDCPMRRSNDVYVSTPHKVVSPLGKDRYAVAFFLDPNPDAVVACLPTCTSSELIFSRRSERRIDSSRTIAGHFGKCSVCARHRRSSSMETQTAAMELPRHTIGIRREDLTRDCLQELRLWPGCETVERVGVLGDLRGKFTIHVIEYGLAKKPLADRAARCIQREKQRFFHLKLE